MPTADTLPELLSALLSAPSFEDAAVATLRSMLAAAATEIAASPRERRGRVLRGMVHLRPATATVA